MNNNTNNTPKTTVEVKPEQPKTAPSNTTETKRKRRTAADIRAEQREKLVEQLNYHERMVATLKSKVEELDNEKKREAILKKLQNRNLEELAKFAEVNLNEL